MNEPLGYSREGDIVTLSMTADDYYKLLVALGMAAGGAGGDMLHQHLALANRLNAGNPQWTPYEIPDPR